MNFIPLKLFVRALAIQLVFFLIGYFIYKFIFPKYEIILGVSGTYFYFLSLSVLSLLVIFIYTLRPLVRINQSLSQLVENQIFSEDFISQSMAYEDNPGEWNDLEVEIKRLIMILRKNFKALSREKIEIQAVMNSVEEPIYAIDQSERVVFYNPAFGMVFGLETGSQSSFSAHQVLPDANVLGAMREVLKTGEPLETQLDIYIASQSYSFTLSVSPLKRETDLSTYGVVAVFHDRSLQIETNKKRIDFVANASHELRTPVTMISSAVSLLMANINNEDLKKELFETLQENSKRLVNLTENLLDLSEVESGDILDIETLGAKDVTAKFLTTNNFTNPNISLITEDTLAVQADPKRLDQVLTNLVTNAVRYSGKNEPIQIIWEGTKAGVFLKVRDKGPGIPHQHIKRIFERFYRVDSARTRKEGGTGIGLAIVNHIMKLHKGEIYVNEDYKEGAEFICFFPSA